MSRQNISKWLQNIDTRILYILLVVMVSIPFLFRMSLPMHVTSPVQKAYNTVDQVPKDKIVILLANWEAGTWGESAPQTEALIQHMFKRGIKFAIFSQGAPVGITFVEQIAEKNAARMHKTYGVDWVNWGYRPGTLAMIQGLPRDIWEIVGKDINGTPLSQIPMMKNIRTIKNVDLIADVTPNLTTTYLWIDYVQGRYGTRIVCSPTAVMVAETYPWLASGQFSGVIPGLRGAAEYQQLVGIKGYAIRAMNAESMAHFLIIALIIIGNIGFFMSRRQKGAKR